MSSTSPLGHKGTENVRQSNPQSPQPGQDAGKQLHQKEQEGKDQYSKQAPRSMPDDSESQLNDSNEGDEGEMVPAAGRINEKGEVIDDDGQVIGKVTSGEASDFVGFIVTQEGDILDGEGGVVGKAEPLEDVASELNYTTKNAGNKQQFGDQQQDQHKQGGGLGSALGGVGNAVSGVAGGVGDTAKGLTGTVGDTTKGATDKVNDATGQEGVTNAVGDTVKGVGDTAGDATNEATKPVNDATGRATDKLGETVEGAEGITSEAGDAVEAAKSTADGAVDDAKSGVEDVPKEGGSKVKGAESAVDGAKGDAEQVGSQVEGAEEAAGEAAEQEPIPIQIPEFTPSIAGKVLKFFEGPFMVSDNGQVTDANGKVLGKLAEGYDFQDLIGKEIKGIDENGNLLGDNETVLGKVDLVPEGTVVERIKDEVPEAADRLDAIEEADKQKLPPISILEGMTINKGGNVVDEKGNLLGHVVEGELKKLIGKHIDDQGQVWDGKGNVIGRVEVLPEAEQNMVAPFEDFPDATVDQYGKVIFDGRQVGVVDADDFTPFIGKKVDADGDILDKKGNVIGHAIRQEAEEVPEPEEEPIDYSMLRDKKVNKFGNVVDDNGNVWGHVVSGVLKNLVGKKVGDNGEIFNDAGKVIGKCEPLPEGERDDAKEPAPFEDFAGNFIGDKGAVMFNGEQIGIVVEGDEKKLKGKSVDPDGEILDKAGNVLGRAERWEMPEEEPEPEVDNSALAGKRVNKAGNCVDSHGDIYGRVIEGNLARLIGKMCDKQGFIRNEGGDVIGKAELVPEAEREGMKEGPFTELPGCTVNKEGHVVTPGGDIVGRLVSGDPKILFGRAVDDDGDILDKNGNVLGHAERWEPEEVPKDVSPMSGRKVNKEGNVVDESGDIIGKLTSGELSKCAGKKIDDDGDVVDQKGSILGHVTLLEDIPEPEPEVGESEEDRVAREKLEMDRKIAGQICVCIEHSLDKIRPICKMITTVIDKEERKKEDERDEEELVKQVRPLIEEGGKILTEANGVIRGLDPDGRISANAKHKTAAREATPEEYRLADLLKELTGTITETIENAKRKIEDMPHAKKELNPLWGLLAEPLFQIIAAVGLLLSGVLGLVGKLLNGLGLGGLVNNLLGGLGLTRVLDNLGLGKVLAPITGGDKKKQGGGGGGGGGGGLLGGIL